ncbi:MAG: gfo/Idh/MocA family oxidoreductase, partial [Planctomycetales bacterium]
AVAATVTALMASASYRQGKILTWDAQQLCAGEADSRWASQWEEMSRNGSPPRHVPGWRAGDAGSSLTTPSYQKLAGPWLGDADPAG